MITTSAGIHESPRMELSVSFNSCGRFRVHTISEAGMIRLPAAPAPCAIPAVRAPISYLHSPGGSDHGVPGNGKVQLPGGEFFASHAHQAGDGGQYVAIALKLHISGPESF